jgi:CHAP domain
MKPYRAVPWDEDMECDCSGFACWTLGMSRFDGMVWYDTSRLFTEAMKGKDLFQRVEWANALPGDLLVYPDRKRDDGRVRQGHVAIVTAVGPGRGPLLIVDCSASNWRRHSDAIREGPPDGFIGNDFAIVSSYTRFSEATLPA